MRNLILAAAVSIATVGVAAPAFAQVDVDVGHGGVRFGLGDRDHYWRDRDHWRGAYAYGDCRTVRERIETPSGRVIYRTHRDCD